MITYDANAPETPRKADWRDDALCRTEDAEDFFPVGASPAAKAAERHAKTVCFRCPALQACGQWALDNREPAGVWGGMSEAERAKILRRRGVRLATVEEEPEPPKPKRKSPEPAVCGTNSGYRKHVRDKTPICGPCRRAHADADNRLRRTGTTKVAV
jgi:hypothetical protein